MVPERALLRLSVLKFVLVAHGKSMGSTAERPTTGEVKRWRQFETDVASILRVTKR